MSSRRVLAIVLVLVACESSGRGVPVDRVPTELARGTQAASAALDRLQERLQGRLAEELQKGGPPNAVAVCRDEARVITDAIAKETGVAVGRTSHRLRNTGNVAPAWVQPFVERATTQPVNEPLAFDLGDKVGVLRPLFVAEPCLGCHGSKDAIDPKVLDVLATAYPDDTATGFRAGELRGYAWAEAPK